MPNITIREINNTQAGGTARLTDVVYIPGFVNMDEGSRPAEGSAIPARVPTMVYSVSDFESYFGKRPAVFKSAQPYDLAGTWKEDAKPVGTDSMFSEGSVDPGYVMAKEILNLGLPVLYERINVDGNISIADMYDAMVGTDAVVVHNYEKNANGDYIITVDSSSPIVHDGEPTVSSTYQEFDSVKTYYKPSVNGDSLYIDGSIVDAGLMYYANAAYFVKKDSAEFVFDSDDEYVIIGDVASKVPSGQGEYKRLTVNDNTSLGVDNMPILSDWYVKISSQSTEPNPYLHSLSSFFLAADVQSATKYTIAEDSTGNLIQVAEGDGFKYVVGVGSKQYKATESVDGTYFALEGDERYYPIPSDVAYSKITVGVTPNFSDTVLFGDIVDGIKFYPYEVYDDVQHTLVEVVYQKYATLNAQEVADYRYNDDVTVAEDAKPSIFANLKDKGEYQVKYITSGGYPVYEVRDNVIVSAMLDTAQDRGDCIALIDHTNNSERSLNDKNVHSVYYSVYQDTLGERGIFRAYGTYSAMFTPWCRYAVPRCGIAIELPASFAYLTALATAVKTNDSYVAIAGATRGAIPYFIGACTSKRLTNAIAESYLQRDRVAINPITTIKPYGNIIWGNRTLHGNNTTSGSNLNADSFLNLRNTISDIKKTVYETAKRYTYEQNSDILWINFKAGITPLLDKMKNSFAISKYKISKGTTEEKAKLVATITIYPIYAVEDFDITIVVEDDDVSVS